MSTLGTRTSTGDSSSRSSCPTSMAPEAKEEVGCPCHRFKTPVDFLPHGFSTSKMLRLFCLSKNNFSFLENSSTGSWIGSMNTIWSILDVGAGQRFHSVAFSLPSPACGRKYLSFKVPTTTSYFSPATYNLHEMPRYNTFKVVRQARSPSLRHTSSCRGVHLCSSCCLHSTNSRREVRFTSACCQLRRSSACGVCCTSAFRVYIASASAVHAAHVTSNVPTRHAAIQADTLTQHLPSRSTFLQLPLFMLVAQLISSLTVSLRYVGALNVIVTEFHTDLVLCLRFHSLLRSYAPSSQRRWPATKSCRWQRSSCLSFSQPS